MVEDHRAEHELDTAREGVHALAEMAPREARNEGRAAAREELRRFWPRVIVAVAVVVGLMLTFGGWAIVELWGHQAATDSAVTALREQAEQSKATGDRANQELAQRGQPQVPIPTPGTAPDTDVIVSAATARVLASLPTPAPTTEQLGAAVARYITANPITPAAPTAGQISEALAGYLAVNPPPSGPPGPTGEPGTNGSNGGDGPTGPAGPGPTADQIETAVGQWLADHPDALCPRGGSIAQIRVQLSDGGSADTYTCVVATYPAPTPSPTSVLPIPTI